MTEYLTTYELAELLKVNPSTVYRAIVAGEIAGVISVAKRGARKPKFRIPRSGADEYLQSKRL